MRRGRLKDRRDDEAKRSVDRGPRVAIRRNLKDNAGAPP